MSTDPGLLPQLFAGWAVGKGALLAGALQKRSAWKKAISQMADMIP